MPCCGTKCTVTLVGDAPEMPPVPAADIAPPVPAPGIAPPAAPLPAIPPVPARAFVPPVCPTPPVAEPPMASPLAPGDSGEQALPATLKTRNSGKNRLAAGIDRMMGGSTCADHALDQRVER